MLALVPLAPIIVQGHGLVWGRVKSEKSHWWGAGVFCICVSFHFHSTLKSSFLTSEHTASQFVVSSLNFIIALSYVTHHHRCALLTLLIFFCELFCWGSVDGNEVSSACVHLSMRSASQWLALLPALYSVEKTAAVLCKYSKQWKQWSMCEQDQLTECKGRTEFCNKGWIWVYMALLGKAFTAGIVSLNNYEGRTREIVRALRCFLWKW